MARALLVLTPASQVLLQARQRRQYDFDDFDVILGHSQTITGYPCCLFGPSSSTHAQRSESSLTTLATPMLDIEVSWPFLRIIDASWDYLGTTFKRGSMSKHTRAASSFTEGLRSTFENTAITTLLTGLKGNSGETRGKPRVPGPATYSS